MLGRFPAETVTVLKTNGTRVEITAHVQSKLIVTEETSHVIEEGDRITRALPNGHLESYVVQEATFHPKMRSISPHYQLVVQKETAIFDSRRESTQNIGMLIQGNVTGGNLSSVGSAQGDVTQTVYNPGVTADEIEKLTRALIDFAEANLGAESSHDYVEAVKEMRDLLLAQEKPDPSRFRNIMSTLSLLDNANGTVELFQKVWPILLAIVNLAHAVGTRI